MNKLFFSQRILDELVREGRITLSGNVITILDRDRPSFHLEPAFRFVRTSDNGPDPHRLTGQIRYEREVRSAGGEVLRDSIIYRDVAYEVEPGFIGEKQELYDRLSDTDLLARFLLENLL